MKCMGFQTSTPNIYQHPSYLTVNPLLLLEPLCVGELLALLLRSSTGLSIGCVPLSKVSTSHL